MSTVPDFIIIGVVKGGSTSIQRHLSTHQEICMSRIKEPGFFGFDKKSTKNGIRKHAISDYEAYYKLFEQPNLITGEASVGYFTNLQAIKEMHNHVPNCKLIVSLRNPVDRLYSQFVFFQQKGFESAKIDFNEFVDSFIDHNSLISKRKMYFERSLYGKYIEEWLKFFPRDQFHFCFFEDFIKDQLGVVNKMLNFLQVTPLVKIQEEAQLAKSGYPRSRLVQSSLKYVTKFSSPLKRLLPESFVRQGSDVLRKARNQNLTKPGMDEVTRKKLAEYFDADKRHFSNLTGVSTELWDD